MPIEPDIVTIPEGTVIMGVPECALDLEAHVWRRVKVNVPAFGIATHAVTVAEYLAFANESGYAICEELRTDHRFQNPRAPAAFISWIDAARYVQWLARMTDKPYRLLRDAEYEKAARGGLESKRYPWGDDPPDGRADLGNPDGSPKTVGSFEPNGYGLFDMVGSVWSWCEECFNQVAGDDRAKLYYEDTAIKDPSLAPVCRRG